MRPRALISGFIRDIMVRTKAHGKSTFLPKSEIASTARRLPQVIQESGKEIRVFTPRYGVINERRHQLHEVIRLSGMNISIDDNDHPLIIKVASVSAAKMQVYFIDNEDYFKRKSVLADDKGKWHKDNDERAMFFCRGVIETVKNLGWQPDVIHCHGWLTGLMGLYIKHAFGKDPHFANTKVIFSLYDTVFDSPWDKRFAEKLIMDGFSKEIAEDFQTTDCFSLLKSMVKYCDGINVASENLSPELQEIYDNASCMKQGYVAEENQAKEIGSLFDEVIAGNILA
jgi:starch synthase